MLTKAGLDTSTNRFQKLTTQNKSYNNSLIIPLIIPCEQVRVWHVAYQNHFESFSKVIKGPRQGVRQSGRCPWHLFRFAAAVL